MKILDLKSFAKMHFGTVTKLAAYINRPANSLYRLNRKGAVVIVEGDGFTIHTRGSQYSLKGGQK